MYLRNQDLRQIPQHAANLGKHALVPPSPPTLIATLHGESWTRVISERLNYSCIRERLGSARAVPVVARQVDSRSGGGKRTSTLR